jgi:ADP-heptose:LPS heptosyltransferase
LEKLLQTKGVSFVSLQAGEAGRQAAGMTVLGEMRDFAETAGVVANLDLVIGVDTAVNHLAGAMGKRVWTLLATAADWRWGLAGEETAWYPTMRLFRQERRGEWDAVVEKVARELEKLAAG